MSTTTLHPLAADYLRRLRRAGRGLPRGAIGELVAEIEVHLAEATNPEMSDAEVLTVLDRLGEPEQIVAAQQPPSDGRGPREWAAIVLLLVGGFIFYVGWLVGLVLLWSSRAWSVKDKWIGTLLIPGGLATGLLVGLSGGGLVGSSGHSCSSSSAIFGAVPVGQHPPRHATVHCTGGTSTVHNVISLLILVVLVLIPLATSVYLSRRARSAPVAA